MTTSIQQAFQACAYLLSYPNKEFLASLEDIEEELELESIPIVKKEIQQFFQKCNRLSDEELVSTYVNTFDFGKGTNLYVTYLSNGEQRERGMDLLFIKNYYKLHGFDVTEKELPDYLPVMLEFASLVDRETMEPLFSRYLNNIKEMVKNFDSHMNVYGHILKAVLLLLAEVGVTKSVRRSDEICSNSFFG